MTNPDRLTFFRGKLFAIHNKFRSNKMVQKAGYSNLPELSKLSIALEDLYIRAVQFMSTPFEFLVVHIYTSGMFDDTDVLDEAKVSQAFSSLTDFTRSRIFKIMKILNPAHSCLVCA